MSLCLYDTSVKLIAAGADVSRVNAEEIEPEFMDRIRAYLASRKKSARK